MKEYKVGEKFELDGVECVVVDDNGDDFQCSGCHIFSTGGCRKARCMSTSRGDGKNIHFEKVNP